MTPRSPYKDRSVTYCYSYVPRRRAATSGIRRRPVGPRRSARSTTVRPTASRPASAAWSPAATSRAASGSPPCASSPSHLGVQSDDRQRGLAAAGARGRDREPAGVRARSSPARSRTGGPRRYRRMTERARVTIALDLSTGTPDASLLPDLGPALARVRRRTLTTSYLDHPVLPELEAVLRERLAVHARGADRRRRRARRPRSRRHGDGPPRRPRRGREPDVPAGARPARAARSGGRRRRRSTPRASGPTRCATGLEAGPVASFLQPRAHNPTGVSMPSARAQALAAHAATP